LFHCDDIAERIPKAIKRDFRALGRLVEGSGAQVVLCSIPSVAGKSTERGRKTHLFNSWLRDWCHRSNFDFFDHGEVYTASGLLVTGGVQLSQRGKRILAHELVGFIERALNWVRRGKGTSPISLEMSPGMACQGQG